MASIHSYKSFDQKEEGGGGGGGGRERDGCGQ